LTVAATGSGTLTYQWRHNGAPIIAGNYLGSTGPSLSINSMSAYTAGIYDCVVSGGCSGYAATSRPALALVAPPPAAPCAPVLTQNPANQSVSCGGAATFSAAATSPAGGGSLSYQWRRNGVALSDSESVSGATTTTLTYSSVSVDDNGAVFDCIVSNACGWTRSDAAGLGTDCRVCPADFNNDGFLNPDDLSDYINAYFDGGCP